MNIINQYDQKNLDSLGRVTIPAGVRKRLQLAENMTVDVFTIVDDEGREYVAFSKSPVQKPKRGSRAKTETENE